MKTETGDFGQQRSSVQLALITVGALMNTQNTQNQTAAAAPEAPQSTHTSLIREPDGGVYKYVRPNKTKAKQLAEFWGGDIGMLNRIAELEEYSQKLEAQRDELLAAAKWGKAAFEALHILGYPNYVVNSKSHYDELCTAIANAEKQVNQ